MRYIRYAILALIAIVLISVSLANRDVVTLRLVPEALAGLLGVTWAISLPLFIVVLGGREVSTKTRELDKLEREVKHLKRGSREEKDEVLALLD